MPRSEILRMMRKISRDAVYSRFPDFPSFRHDEASDTDHISFPRPLRTGVLELRHAVSAEDRFLRMAGALTTMCRLLPAAELVFMGQSRTPWRYQQSDYPPARRADAFLAGHRVGRSFNGGLCVGRDALVDWLPQLLWLITSNASLPEIYFVDPGQQVVGSFCRYANLHLYLLDPAAGAAFDHFVADGTMRPVPGGQCRDHSDAMPAGRFLMLD